MVITDPPYLVSYSGRWGSDGEEIEGDSDPSTSRELYAYQVVARDPENGLVSYALTVAPAGMTINANTGLLRWLSTRASVGTHAVTVRVSDVAGNAATQSFSVQVERGNKLPTFTSTPATTSRVGSASREAERCIHRHRGESRQP